MKWYNYLGLYSLSQMEKVTNEFLETNLKALKLAKEVEFLTSRLNDLRKTFEFSVKHKMEMSYQGIMPSPKIEILNSYPNGERLIIEGSLKPFKIAANYPSLVSNGEDYRDVVFRTYARDLSHYMMQEFERNIYNQIKRKYEQKDFL